MQNMQESLPNKLPLATRITLATLISASAQPKSDGSTLLNVHRGNVALAALLAAACASLPQARPDSPDTPEGDAAAGAEQEKPEQSERFNAVEQQALGKAGVSLQEAAKWPETFNGIWIAKFVSTGKTREYIARFPSYWKPVDIYQAINLSVTPEQLETKYRGMNLDKISEAIRYERENPKEAQTRAKQREEYPDRFSDDDIKKLTEAGVSHEIAVQYDKRFRADDIIRFGKTKTSPQQVAAYLAVRDNFTTEGILAFIQNKVPPKDIEGYDRRFTERDILEFNQEYWIGLKTKRIPPQEANGFPKRFNGCNIRQLNISDVTAEVAAAYDERFTAEDICKLRGRNAYGEKYAQRAPVPPEEANTFAPQYNGSNIQFALSYHGIRGQQTHGFPDTYPANLINTCIKHGKSPEDMSRYPQNLQPEKVPVGNYDYDSSEDKISRWDDRKLGAVIEAGISPELAIEYSQQSTDLNGLDIAALHVAGVSPQELQRFPGLSVNEILVLSYPPRFTLVEIFNAFIYNNISPELAAAYNERFTAGEIGYMHACGVMSEEANSNPDATVEEIVKQHGKH